MRLQLSGIKEHIDAVRKFLDPPLGPDAQPLEVRAAVVDAIENRIAVLDVGRKVFPYDRIVVQLITGPGRDKAPLAMVFADLEHKVRERLQERRCEPPETLRISVSIAETPPSDWVPGQLFAIDYGARVDARQDAPVPAWPLLKLTVLRGTALQTAYAFRERTILIGRTAEALDTKGRVRRNHVAFDDRNATVSRAHARLKYDAAHARYRVVDERSTRGTRVVRDGITIPVPHDSRGIRLESGDELCFGDAAVRVTIE